MKRPYGHLGMPFGYIPKIYHISLEVFIIFYHFLNREELHALTCPLRFGYLYQRNIPFVNLPHLDGFLFISWRQKNRCVAIHIHRETQHTRQNVSLLFAIFNILREFPNTSLRWYVITISARHLSGSPGKYSLPNYCSVIITASRTSNSPSETKKPRCRSFQLYIRNPDRNSILLKSGSI